MFSSIQTNMSTMRLQGNAAAASGSFTRRSSFKYRPSLPATSDRLAPAETSDDRLAQMVSGEIARIGKGVRKMIRTDSEEKVGALLCVICPENEIPVIE